MPQHDFVVDNAPGQPVRLDLQTAIQALATCSSGPVEPTTMYPGMIWLDTSFPPDGVLRQRNQANTAWTALLFSAQLLPFISPDMSMLGRTSPNRIVINDKADGTGADLWAMRDDGQLMVPANSAQPLGTVIERLATPSPYTWNKPAGIKALEIEAGAPGASAGASAATNASTYGLSSGGGAGSWGKIIIPAASLPSSLLITLGSPGAPTSADGQAGGTTTIVGGSINLALPGGAKGLQGANVPAGLGNIAGSGLSAAPTGGWLISSAGESSDSTAVGVGTSNIGYRGASGGSPYGSRSPMVWAANTPIGTIAGNCVGGSGSTSGVSQALKQGGIGAPSFVRLKEHF